MRCVFADRNAFAGLSEHHLRRYRINIRNDWEERSSDSITLAVDSMLVSPQNPYVEALTPSGKVFRDKAFGGDVMRVEPSRWDSYPYEKRPRRKDLSAVGGHSKKAAVLEREEGSHQSPDGGLLESRTVRKKCLLFKSPSLVFCGSLSQYFS